MSDPLIIILLSIGLKEVGAAVGLILGFMALVGVAGAAWYSFRAQRAKVKGDSLKDKHDAVQELSDIVQAQGLKIDLLQSTVDTCESEHKKCSLRVNELTEYNLQMQARESRFQKTVNRMERALSLPETDWLDVTDATKNSTFGR